MLVIAMVAALRLAVTSGRLVVGGEAELYLEAGQLDTLVEAGIREVIANTGSASGGYSDHLFR